ncbi:hypothetical protein [Marinobacterium sediminicola]|uniref:PH (Pleckstrin Homology) domain-containing protein n=1 Tax=Marinobacterium sediminicola TaxID=518898 RepID=A0ABY1RZL9_9GAMM|nr:hypothetical protein [Marinobacterium sediminicola]ULG69909.1 hypothetical protein LN244_03625 [Marinobacterium sediminicola]SMR74358.1 hypothetical protein SAMN04487964_1064 [Marinobacterium sediminicola]
MLGFIALSKLSVEPERLLLIIVTYLLVGSVIIWQLLVMHTADQLVGLDWDVEHKMMSVLTTQGKWVPVDKVYNRLVVPGMFYLLVLQRRDRALRTWFWITPGSITGDDARRLSVAMKFGAPIAPNPATEN